MASKCRKTPAPPTKNAQGDSPESEEEKSLPGPASLPPDISFIISLAAVQAVLGLKDYHEHHVIDTALRMLQTHQGHDPSSACDPGCVASVTCGTELTAESLLREVQRKYGFTSSHSLLADGVSAGGGSPLQNDADGGRLVDQTLAGNNTPPQPNSAKATTQETGELRRGSSSASPSMDQISVADAPSQTQPPAHHSSDGTTRTGSSVPPQAEAATPCSPQPPSPAACTELTSSPPERDTRHAARARLAKLRADNQRLKARRLCRRCRQHQANLTLLPCGHLCLCTECGPAVDQCPLCGTTILADVRTFVA